MATDGINLLTMLLIAAFAIDRVSAGILFLLEMVGALADPDACEEGVNERVQGKGKHCVTLWSRVF